jgi:hypothetical protein
VSVILESLALLRLDPLTAASALSNQVCTTFGDRMDLANVLLNGIVGITDCDTRVRVPAGLCLVSLIGSFSMRSA